MPPPTDLFKSTAPFYVRYRPVYPAALFAHIVERFGLNGSGRLLDLGCGPGNLTMHHDALLARSAFARIEQYRLEYQLTWDIERIIGNLLSTSYCSPAVLGNLREPFERDLRAALLALNPEGVFTEDVVLKATLAWRRSGAR